MGGTISREENFIREADVVVMMGHHFCRGPPIREKQSLCKNKRKIEPQPAYTLPSYTRRPFWRITTHCRNTLVSHISWITSLLFLLYYRCHYCFWCSFFCVFPSMKNFNPEFFRPHFTYRSQFWCSLHRSTKIFWNHSGNDPKTGFPKAKILCKIFFFSPSHWLLKNIFLFPALHTWARKR